MEKGYEIPIMVSPAFDEPSVGAFKRLGMDLVGNATWLAYYWAKQETSRAAVTALESLILEWPFDVIRINGTSPEEIEENKFKYAVNMMAGAERLRDSCGA